MPQLQMIPAVPKDNQPMKLLVTFSAQEFATLQQKYAHTIATNAAASVAARSSSEPITLEVIGRDHCLAAIQQLAQTFTDATSKTHLQTIEQAIVSSVASNSLLVLPNEVLRKTALFLPNPDIKRLGQTCKTYGHQPNTEHRTLRVLYNRRIEPMRIKAMTSDADSTFLLRNNDSILVCGENKVGGLGLGHTNNVTTPTPLTALDRYTIKQIVNSGVGATFFVCKNGSVFSCGMNETSQLGLGHTNKVTTPTPIIALQEHTVSQIVCHYAHTFFLCADGSVWVCGNNEEGVLGLDHTNPVTTPTLLTTLKEHPVSQIVLCELGTFFLCRDGSVWACGYNNTYELGLDSTAVYRKPTRITALKDHKISQIIPSPGATYFIDQNGTVLVCGCNLKGDAGLGHKFTVSTPTPIPTLKDHKVTQIVRAWGASFFVCQDGAVFSCGNNGSGRLGVGHDNPVFIPTLITALQGRTVSQITMSKGSVFFVCQDGAVLACGNNDKGQLGLGHNLPVCTPTPMTALQNHAVKQIVCAYDMTFFQSHNGAVFVCGQNKNDYLGLGRTTIDTPTAITALQGHAVSQIEDSHATFFLCQGGSAFAFNKSGFTPLTNIALQHCPWQQASSPVQSSACLFQLPSSTPESAATITSTVRPGA